MIVGSGLAASGLVAAGLRPRLAHAAPIDIEPLLPARFDGWISSVTDDVVVAPDALSKSIYDSLTAKRYTSPAAPPVTLVIAYGPAQSYESQLHRPEICYPASGFRILRQLNADLRMPAGTLPASLLWARRGERADAVLYWSRIGEQHPRGLWTQRFAIARAALTRGGSDGVLVRLSCPARSEVADRVVLSGFASALTAALSPAGRELLIGRLNANRQEA